MRVEATKPPHSGQVLADISYYLNQMLLTLSKGVSASSPQTKVRIISHSCVRCGAIVSPKYKISLNICKIEIISLSLPKAKSNKQRYYGKFENFEEGDRLPLGGVRL